MRVFWRIWQVYCGVIAFGIAMWCLAQGGTAHMVTGLVAGTIDLAMAGFCQLQLNRCRR